MSVTILNCPCCGGPPESSCTCDSIADACNNFIMSLTGDVTLDILLTRGGNCTCLPATGDFCGKTTLVCSSGAYDVVGSWSTGPSLCLIDLKFCATSGTCNDITIESGGTLTVTSCSPAQLDGDIRISDPSSTDGHCCVTLPNISPIPPTHHMGNVHVTITPSGC